MEYKNNITPVTPTQEAYAMFEMSFFANARVIGDLVHGKYDEDAIRQNAYKIEESAFEAIEAGCFSEFDGLVQLMRVLEENESALRYYGREEIADEIKQRLDVVVARIEELAAENPQY